MAPTRNRLTDKEWNTYVTWCEDRGLQAVPSHPWTLAAYALSRENRCKPEDIRKTVTDVGKAHSERARSRPDRADLVSRTLAIIEKRSEVRAQGAELFEEDCSPEQPEATTRKKDKEKRKAGSGRVLAALGAQIGVPPAARALERYLSVTVWRATKVWILPSASLRVSRASPR